MKWAVRSLAVIYLLLLLALWGFIHFDTGAVWPVTLFLFSPRWALAAPLLVLIPLTVAFQFRLVFVYVLHALIILFPIMGCRLAWNAGGDAYVVQPLNILTCNLGGGEIRTAQLVSLASSHNVHVMVLQECSWSTSKTTFEQLGWCYQQEQNIAIGSCFELSEMQILVTQSASQYNAIAAVSCDLRLPANPRSANPRSANSRSPDTRSDHPEEANQELASMVRIFDVHLPTFRPAFELARGFNRDTGAAIYRQGTFYREIVDQVKQHVEASALPTIVAGDFNVPVESAYYRDYWSDYQNALSQVGSGLQYTKHTRLHGVRIDHVLADDRWTVTAACVGPEIGGDHRPVIVELSLDPK